MTVTAVNDTVTYKSARGDIVRDADVVVVVNADGTAVGGAGTTAAMEALLTSIDASLNDIETAAESTTATAVQEDSNTVFANNVALTVKFAAISLSASGDLLALVSSKKLRVLSLSLLALTAVTAKFQSGGSTDLTGAYPLGATGGFVLPFNRAGWFETAAGAKLNLVLGASVAVAGQLTYIEV